jgi:hypothetical protein
LNTLATTVLHKICCLVGSAYVNGNIGNKALPQMPNHFWQSLVNTRNPKAFLAMRALSNTQAILKICCIWLFYAMPIISGKITEKD